LIDIRNCTPQTIGLGDILLPKRGECKLKLFDSSILEYKDYGLNNTDSFDFESAFCETIDFLIDHIREDSKYKMEMYGSLSEASDFMVINESMKDALESFKEWIKKAIEYIKKQAKKFFDKMATWVESNTYVKRNIHLLREAPEFTAKGVYEFKYLCVIEEDPSKLTHLLDPIKSIADKVDTITSNISADGMNAQQLVKEFRTGVDNMSITDTALDKIRGGLLGYKHSVTKDTYNEQIKKLFHDGKTEPGDVQITKEYLKYIADVYDDDGYEKLMKSVYEYIKELEGIYDDSVKSLYKLREKVKKIIGDDTGEDAEKENLHIIAMAYITKMTNYISYLNGDIMLFLSALLDAIREMAVQNNNIAVQIIRKATSGEVNK